MIKSILHLKIYEQESYESFFETFLLLYPTSCYQIVSQLMMEPNLSSLVILMLNMDLMYEAQEKTILVKWLSIFFLFFLQIQGAGCEQRPRGVAQRHTPMGCGTVFHMSSPTSFLPPPSPQSHPQG